MDAGGEPGATLLLPAAAAEVDWSCFCFCWDFRALRAAFSAFKRASSAAVVSVSSSQRDLGFVDIWRRRRGGRGSSAGGWWGDAMLLNLGVVSGAKGVG